MSLRNRPTLALSVIYGTGCIFSSAIFGVFLHKFRSENVQLQKRILIPLYMSFVSAIIVMATTTIIDGMGQLTTNTTRCVFAGFVTSGFGMMHYISVSVFFLVRLEKVFELSALRVRPCVNYVVGILCGIICGMGFSFGYFFYCDLSSFGAVFILGWFFFQCFLSWMVTCLYLRRLVTMAQIMEGNDMDHDQAMKGQMNMSRLAVKQTVLVTCSTISLTLMVISGFTSFSPYEFPVAAVFDYMVNLSCLFLSFRFGDYMYFSLCGCCHRLGAKRFDHIVQRMDVELGSASPRSRAESSTAAGSR